MNRILITMLLLAVMLPMTAQEKITDRMQQSEWGKGTVVIHQDSALYNLIGHIRTPNASGKQLHAKGYRIQIYAGGNSRAARQGALNAASTIRTNFPELPVYTEFASPRWVCRVGDYRTYEEAELMLRDIRKLGIFKELVILPNQTINVSY